MMYAKFMQQHYEYVIEKITNYLKRMEVTADESKEIIDLKAQAIAKLREHNLKEASMYKKIML